MADLYFVNGSRLVASYSSVHFYVSGSEISERAGNGTSRVLKLAPNGRRAFLTSIRLLDLEQSHPQTCVSVWEGDHF